MDACHAVVLFDHSGQDILVKMLHLNRCHSNPQVSTVFKQLRKKKTGKKKGRSVTQKSKKEEFN